MPGFENRRILETQDLRNAEFEKPEDEEEEGQFNHIKTVTCKRICSVAGTGKVKCDRCTRLGSN